MRGLKSAILDIDVKNGQVYSHSRHQGNVRLHTETDWKGPTSITVKIAHYIGNLPLGGTGTILVDILNEQARANQVFLIIGSQNISGELRSALDERIEVFSINRKQGGRNLLDIIRLNLILSRMRPDVIHCHDVIGLARLIPFHKCRKVITIHNVIAPRRKDLLRYRAVYAISEAVQRSINRGPVKLSKIIYNGINFTSGKKIPEALGSRVFKIVQVGRLDHSHKGQDILISAVKHVTSEYGQKNIHADFIGSGPSEAYLRGLAARLNVGEFCSFLGPMDRTRIYENLCNYDLLVHPSRYEGFGLTVLEGIAAGLPVLASNTGGPGEIIGNGGCGILFENGDPVACANGIIEVMSRRNTPDFKKWLEGNYKYAYENFNVASTAEKYVEEYLALK